MEASAQHHQTRRHSPTRPLQHSPFTRHATPRRPVTPTPWPRDSASPLRAPPTTEEASSEYSSLEQRSSPRGASHRRPPGLHAFLRLAGVFTPHVIRPWGAPEGTLRVEAPRGYHSGTTRPPPPLRYHVSPLGRLGDHSQRVIRPSFACQQRSSSRYPQEPRGTRQPSVPAYSRHRAHKVWTCETAVCKAVIYCYLIVKEPTPTYLRTEGGYPQQPRQAAPTG